MYGMELAVKTMIRSGLVAMREHRRTSQRGAIDARDDVGGFQGAHWIWPVCGVQDVLSVPVLGGALLLLGQDGDVLALPWQIDPRTYCKGLEAQRIHLTEYLSDRTGAASCC